MYKVEYFIRSSCLTSFSAWNFFETGTSPRLKIGSLDRTMFLYWLKELQQHAAASSKEAPTEPGKLLLTVRQRLWFKSPRTVQCPEWAPHQNAGGNFVYTPVSTWHVPFHLKIEFGWCKSIYIIALRRRINKTAEGGFNHDLCTVTKMPVTDKIRADP